MITAKLLEFHKLGITIERDAQNPHFRSRYSSLNEVLGKVKEPLTNLGVLVMQLPAIEYYEGVATPGLKTELVDVEDDTRASCFLPYIGATDMQKLGGALSYARRYSLIAILGLEDEDDDANAVSTPKAAPRAAQRPTAPVQTASAPSEEPVISIDDLTF